MYRKRIINKPPCSAWNIVFILKRKEWQRRSAVRTYCNYNERVNSITYMGRCGSLCKFHDYYFITSTSITTYKKLFKKTGF